MIDKYQLYMLYSNMKKMWNAKRFDTVVFRDFMDSTLDEYLIGQYVREGRGTEYMSNWFIPVANEINCSFTTPEAWTMYVMEKCLVDRIFPKPKDISSVSRLRPYAIFTRRPFIAEQVEKVNRITESVNGGFDYFTDNRFSLYGLDGEQVNEAYKMYLDGELDPEFYIRGLESGRFELDEKAVKDREYRRFIAFSRMIIKLHGEISRKK